MNIGQAAKDSGVTAKMIRYYEQIGLIPPANRRESGYRHYSASDVHMLQFIRRGVTWAFRWRRSMSFWASGATDRAKVKRIAMAHISELREKIDSLEQIASTLQALIECCSGDKRPDGPNSLSLYHAAQAKSDTSHPVATAFG